MEKYGDRALHWMFRAAILIKGVDGLLELASGIIFLSVPPQAWMQFFVHLMQSDWIEDPTGLVARWLRHGCEHLSAANRVFVSTYLLGHGVVKVMLVAGLWRDKRWVYPVATVAVLGLIAYQVFRLCHHFSTTLTVLMLFDVVLLGLIWREYHSHVRRQQLRMEK